MKKVLITGGAGFIGSHLTKQLITEGHQITSLDNLSTGSLKNVEEFIDNKRFNLITSDILKADLVDELVKENDIVYHLAAVVGVKHVMENPVDTIESTHLDLKTYFIVVQSTEKECSSLLHQRFMEKHAIQFFIRWS